MAHIAVFVVGAGGRWTDERGYPSVRMAALPVSRKLRPPAISRYTRHDRHRGRTRGVGRVSAPLADARDPQAQPLDEYDLADLERFMEQLKPALTAQA